MLLKETGGFQSYALYAAADPYEGGSAGDPAGFVAGDGRARRRPAAQRRLDATSR